MQFVIDVHPHSRFARATSRDLNCSNLHKWSALKGHERDVAAAPRARVGAP